MLKNLLDLAGPDGIYGFSDMTAAEIIETILSKYDSEDIKEQLKDTSQEGDEELIE